MLLSIAAVAISTALLIVVASLFTGFIAAYEQSAVDAIGDVVLTPPAKLPKYSLLIEQLETLPVVEAATAVLTSDGLIHLGGGNVRAVLIWGIEPNKRGKVTAFDKSLVGGDASLNRDAHEHAGDGAAGAVVGIGLITEPNELTDEYDMAAVGRVVGRQAVLTSGSVTQADNTQQRQFKRRTLKVDIADAAFTGVYWLDSKVVYVPIDDLRRALYPDQQEPFAEQLQIKLTPGADADAAIAQIRGVWRLFAAEQLGWEDYLIRGTDIFTSKWMQHRFVAELRKQMGVLLLIFGVVSFSVVLLIFCIFYMIVETRRKDIAIVKSCGAGSCSVAAVFLGFGGCIGAIGAAIGAVLGYIVTTNINVIEGWIRVVFGLKLWKSSVYLFSKIPNEVNWNWATAIAISAIIAAAIGAIVPAISAAITRPVNVLRYE